MVAKEQETGSTTATTSTTIAPWGRYAKVSYVDTLSATFMLALAPSLTTVCFAVCKNYECSFSLFFQDFSFEPEFVYKNMPKFSWHALILYLGWVVAQGIMYHLVPGRLGQGQRTPAGLLLDYRVNGFSVYMITVIVFLLGSWIGLFKLTIIVEHWEGGLVAANIYGYALTLFAYVKATWFPTHKQDRKFSGSVMYDLFMGVEFNPRFGKLFDFKLFTNGRPGIIAWTLINISFAASQYSELGRITNSMMLVNGLQLIYVLDFFWHEDWYLRTIDIAHDHFGFYLAWGSSVWLPWMYTLQAQYCYRTNVELPRWAAIGVSIMGALGYIVFRQANDQKDRVRRTDGECVIWGTRPEVIRTCYATSDGKVHRSLLLVSGYWGFARQPNYMGDLSLSLAMCLACGINDLLPHFYIIYMFILLNHRIIRSEFRCRSKYGVTWSEYTSRVEAKLCPLIY